MVALLLLLPLLALWQLHERLGSCSPYDVGSGFCGRWGCGGTFSPCDNGWLLLLLLLELQRLRLRRLLLRLRLRRLLLQLDLLRDAERERPIARAKSPHNRGCAGWDKQLPYAEH